MANRLVIRRKKFAQIRTKENEGPSISPVDTLRLPELHLGLWRLHHAIRTHDSKIKILFMFLWINITAEYLIGLSID